MLVLNTEVRPMRPGHLILRCGAMLAATALTSAQAPQTIARDTPITSAVFRIERRAILGRVLHVENLRDEPVQTWVISTGSRTLYSDFSRRQPPFSRGEGPIVSHEVRAIRVEEGSPAEGPAYPTVHLAVFEDGWVEGDKAYVDAWAQVRRRRADDATHWLGTLDQAKGRTDSEAKAMLRAAVVLRRQQLAENPGPQAPGPFDGFFDPDAEMSRVASMVDDHSQRPPGWFAARLANLRDDLLALRSDMLRPQVQQGGLGQGAKPLVRSVTVRVVNEPVTTVFATIENLRDVPIESFEFELFDSPTRLQPSNMRRHDSGAVDGRGERIQPGEVRSIPVGDPAVTPTGRLTFVLYDDLVFQGSLERRDDLFRSREQEADEYAYWIAALGEARSKALADVREFLNAKRRERIQATGVDRRGAVDNAMHVASNAESRPDVFVQSVDAIRARMERVRQALTRHLKR